MPLATQQRMNANLLRIPLRQEEIDELQAAADKEGVELEVLMARQLRAYGTIGSMAMVLKDSEKIKIQEALGMNMNGIMSGGLGTIIGNLMKMQVGGLNVQLPRVLLARLRSRCIGEQDFRAWLQKIVVQELEHYVGMR